MRLIAPRQRIEKVLLVRGVVSPGARQLLCTQLLLTDISLALGVACAWFTLWPLAFGLGAAIALHNFWHLVRFAQAHILREFGVKAGARLIFGSNFRLVLTGIALYLLIVVCRVPVFPLIAGLSSVIVGITLWGFSKLQQTPIKET